MRYMIFGEEKGHYPVALITRVLVRKNLQDHVAGITEDVVAYALTTSAKAKNPELRTYLDELLPILCGLQTEYLVITDAGLFKLLTKSTRVDRIGGYVLPCVLEGFTHFWVVYVPDPRTVMMDPKLGEKLSQGRQALADHRAGIYQPPGVTVLHEAHYPKTLNEIRDWLHKLVDKDLACDIEAFSLKHHTAGLGTIAMAWDQHRGIAFAIDLATNPNDAEYIRAMLRAFFVVRAQRNTTKTIWHNGAYDCYVITYQLFMTGLLDTEGLLTGLQVMMTGFEDTQLITYLATNSCAGNVLGLKAQAQEFIGNYAVDVQDIRSVPLDKLLEYNLYDSLGTWFVYKKHWPTVVADQQVGVYYDYFLPFTADIIQMQLTGLPVNMPEVKRGKAIMELHRQTAVYGMRASSPVQLLELQLRLDYVDKKNAEYKKKRITVDDILPNNEDVLFNPNSAPKLQKLLYEIMGLPVISYTKTKQPGTDGDTIEALINHTQDLDYKDFLQHLIDFKNVDKILNSFIPAFEDAALAEDGWYYLFGFFKLGGTQSGRLSSSDPNLQNLPATGSKYAKLIKKMVKAPPGWIFVGLDFNSLEDRISALTTKDPNKLKVYTDGYDGHSLRAYSYFGEQMPDIDPTSVASINSISKKYKSFRQDSKAPTFALTYMGTFATLMKNCGFTKKVAQEIEERYHQMYAVSDQWVQARIDEAAACGYVTLAFGLRLRTPMLGTTVLGNRATPQEAEAEKRSAGNALGQSYCLLNSRAGNAFLKIVRQSVHRLDIRPCVHIHDAQYYLVREDVQLIHWINETLVPCVEWQALPEIEHPDVKLGGELSIFFPTWNDELTIPNGATVDQILSLASEHHKDE